MGHFFSACMNVDQANALGTKPLAPTLAAIAALHDKQEIAGLLGNKRLLGQGFFSFTAEQDQKDAQRMIASLHQAGLTLPDRGDYLDSGSGLAAYRHYLVNTFRLLGDRPNEAAAEAGYVLEIETALAKGAMSRVDERDPTKIYHPISPERLTTLTPGFNWQAYFGGIGTPRFTILNAAEPEYLRTMARVIGQASLPALKSYLRIHAVTPMAPYLSQPFEQASFDFFNKSLRGQTAEQARWKRCTALTDKELTDAVAQQWVKKNFSPAEKAGAEQIIANVRLALRREIGQLAWLSAQAKQEAMHKIDGMRQKIGYPAHWRDYSSVQIGPSNFVADLHNAEIFNRGEELREVGKPVDEGRFVWSVPTADAMYDEHLNDIEFPAGILQPPYYSPRIDAAVNYGAIGSLVGHEMTHGFDDEGSRYDERGNLRNWFTPQDQANFDRMTACAVNEYSSFEVLPGLKLDGRLSLGENTADNGGLRIAYDTLQKMPNAEPARKIEGYTPDQRFLIGFAQIWCEQRRDAYQRVRGRTDPHPPGEFRVNGTVENFRPFGEAFGCRIGQPMMPANACRIW